MPDTSLPSSWEECSLGAVVDYGTTRKAEPGEIPPDGWVLELEDIEKDTSKLLQRVTFAQRQSKSTKNQFAAGDVLYGKLRPYLNKVIRADQDGYCTTEIIPLKPSNELDGRYLFYWLKHPRFLEYVDAVSHGLNMPRLGTEAGKIAPFVLAPINEQKRIADKLDAVVARVDACRDRLDRVPAILKRFRQSVLAAAIAGKLTEEWREAHNAMPWRHTHLRDLAVLITKGASPKWQGISYVDAESRGTLFVTSENVREMRMDLSEPKYVESSFDKKQRRSVLRRGDILTNIVGASIGRSAIFDSEKLANINQAVCLIRLKEDVNRHFVLYTLSAPATLEFIHGEKVDVARANVSLEDVGNIPILVPNIEEQGEIARRVQALFAYADSLEARYTAARKQVESLTPALLAKAFSGDLVPQDPNDEPASVLLDRIRAARTEQPSKGRELKPRMTKPSRNSKEKSIMAKSRFDDDVKGKPYLASLLGEIGGNAKIEDLFKRAELPVVDFYKQLAWEVEQGHILDSETRLEMA